MRRSVCQERVECCEESRISAQGAEKDVVRFDTDFWVTAVAKSSPFVLKPQHENVVHSSNRHIPS